MNTVFVDTSAIYASLVADDQRHARARTALAEIRQEGASLVTSSFVLHESVALLQARSGIEAVRHFHERLVPLFARIDWIDEETYARAMNALLAARSTRISLTDWTSFELMRSRGIDRAFAFDAHFEKRGFVVLPGGRTRGR